MEDITPNLIKAVTDDFHRFYESSPTVQELLKKLREGTATYVEAQKYSLEVSKLIGKAYEKHITSVLLPDGRMYYNIASRLLPSTLDENYAMVSAYTEAVQKSLNENAGLGLKAQTVRQNQDRVDGLVELVSNAEQYDDVSAKLKSAFDNYSQNIVDETLRANVNFQGRSGLTPKVIRRAERKCCQWCSDLAGVYDYPDVPDEVYQRHENCRCTVEYDPADGKRRRQNVHTKRWTDDPGYDTLEARKKVGLRTLASDLSKHPGRLASFTPAQLLEKFEQEGLEVKPLKQGSLKNIPFSEGGGFKVNFEDGGLFQYHPAEKSHHGGAYYKISTGKGGIKRYELDGTEKIDEKTKK